MNISKDEMTSKERMKAYFAGKTVDRIPCLPLLGETAVELFGYNLSQYYESYEIMKEVEVGSYKMFGSDGISMGITRKGIGEALGTKMGYSEDRIKYIISPILKDYTQLDNFKIIDPYKDKNMVMVLKAIGLVEKEVGNEVNINFEIGAPLSSAGAIRGTTHILKDMVRRSEKLHQLLDYTTECILEYVKVAYEEYGIGISLSDPLSSCDLIGVKDFKEFSKPYMKKCVDEIVKITRKEPSLHICGKTQKIWNDLLDLQIGSFSVDNIEDMEELKEVMGDYVTIIGNIDPVSIIAFGSKQDILKASKECIEKAIDSPKGFILSTGCQIPLGTSKENIEIFMESSRIYASNVKMSGKD